MKFVFLCILLNENCSVKVKLMETKFIPLFFCKNKRFFYWLQQNKITMNILKIKLQVEHYLTYTIVGRKIWIECIRVRGISCKNLSLQTIFNDPLLFYLYNKFVYVAMLRVHFLIV